MASASVPTLVKNNYKFNLTHTVGYFNRILERNEIVIDGGMVKGDLSKVCEITDRINQFDITGGKLVHYPLEKFSTNFQSPLLEIYITSEMKSGAIGTGRAMYAVVDPEIVSGQMNPLREADAHQMTIDAAARSSGKDYTARKFIARESNKGSPQEPMVWISRTMDVGGQTHTSNLFRMAEIMDACNRWVVDKLVEMSFISDEPKENSIKVGVLKFKPRVKWLTKDGKPRTTPAMMFSIPIDPTTQRPKGMISDIGKPEVMPVSKSANIKLKPYTVKRTVAGKEVEEEITNENIHLAFPNARKWSGSISASYIAFSNLGIASKFANIKGCQLILEQTEKFAEPDLSDIYGDELPDGLYERMMAAQSQPADSASAAATSAPETAEVDLVGQIGALLSGQQ